ncbi:hypothetical protein HS125_04475 [bacterium]|nr:hypothetical protein [bacterium]
MAKIYNLPETTSANAADLLALYQAGKTKKITHGSLVESLRGQWMDRWIAVDSAKYDAVPKNLYCSGPTNFSDPSGRPGNSTGVSEGTVIKEAGILYMAVKGGTTGTSAPTFPETPGTTVDDGSPTPVTWCAMANHVLELSSENGLAAVIAPGAPLKYTSGDDTYYGLCIGINDDYLGIAGAQLPASLDALYYGRPEMVVRLDYYAFLAAYGGLSNGTDLLGNTSLGTPFSRWGCGRGYLVDCRFRHNVIQSSATTKQPRINPLIAGQAVSNWWDGEGVAAPPENTRWSAGGVGSMLADKYRVDFGDAIGLQLQQGGSGGGSTAQYLSAELVFVLE